MNVKGGEGNSTTVFHSAVIGGNAKLVEMLIKNSMILHIDLNAKETFDHQFEIAYESSMYRGLTAFHMACKNSDLKIAMMLIDYSSIYNILFFRFPKFDHTWSQKSTIS